MTLSILRLSAAASGLLMLGACAGPLANNEFACEAAKTGGVCASPSAVLQGSAVAPSVVASSAPASNSSDPAAPTIPPVVLAPGNLRATNATPAPPPVDSATIADARVVRIWVAPHQADNGALVVSGYVYGEIEPRSWNVGFVGDNDTSRGRTFQPLQAGGS